ncbi:MAG TPA: transglutaminase domain-containing protein [Candidatus Binatia bacterium]|nr:transglutaminase domain-containing protein [Candidatus Binatia bacterium]
MRVPSRFLPCLLSTSIVLTGAASASAAEPRKAVYQVQSRLAVTVPEEALRVRIWLPMPQKDAVSQIEDLATAVELGGTAVPAANADAETKSGAERAARKADGDGFAAKGAGANKGDVAHEDGDAGKADSDAKLHAAGSKEAGGPALTVGRDSHGNEIGYVEVARPRAGEIVIQQSFTLTRSEMRGDLDAARTRPLTAEEKKEHRQALEASTYIPLSPDIRKLAGEIVGDEKNPLRIARKIYDWELANVDYWAKDPDRYEPSPMGSAVYCLSTRSGNCADFHSLYIALARAAGVPARMVYGSLLKKQMQGSRDDAGTHCWVEVFFPELGWQSVDVSLADLYHGNVEKTPKNEKLLAAATPTGVFGENAEMTDYYFGNLDERRVVWSRGRDIMLDPPQAGIALNSLPKAYVEIDGKEHGGWKRTTTFKEAASAQ